MRQLSGVEAASVHDALDGKPNEACLLSSADSERVEETA
jgi:hypothetical protein